MRTEYVLTGNYPMQHHETTNHEPLIILYTDPAMQDVLARIIAFYPSLSGTEKLEDGTTEPRVSDCPTGEEQLSIACIADPQLLVVAAVFQELYENFGGIDKYLSGTPK